jgi:hypothetical protein
MAQVDFKVTVWERVIIDDDKLDEVMAKIKSGEITSSDDLLNEDCNAYFEGTVEETLEQMTPEENDNQSTIEVLDDDGNTICSNVD